MKAPQAPIFSHTVSTYFLDESGHSGDLATSDGLDFAGQPYFSLACVGVGNPEILASELDQVRRSYRCGDDELKSNKLNKKLAPIARHLIDFLSEQRWPIFVELVDKKFFVAAHVVNHLLCGPYDSSEVDLETRNAIAEFFVDEGADHIIGGYLAACRTQTIEAVSSLIDEVWTWLDRSDEDIARDAQLLTMYTRDRVRVRDAKATAFLPIADSSETGKPVWILPNLQCLTNTYARINQSRDAGLAGSDLVHDGQMQYAKVLKDGKASMEHLAAMSALPILPFGDYNLQGNSRLRFADSKAEPCLQASDILAGLAMRFARGADKRRGRGDPALREAFMSLLDAGNPCQSTGLNLVMSGRSLDLMGVPHTSPFEFRGLF